MASTLNDFLASHGGDENAVFITLATNADKRGTAEEGKLARGGVDPSVWAWYDQRLAGQMTDQAVEQATTGSQAFTQNLQDTGQINEQGLSPQETEQNQVAQQEYQQRLQTLQASQPQTAVPQTGAQPTNIAPVTQTAQAGTTQTGTREQEIQRITQEAQGIQSKVDQFSQAEQGGMEITPNTTFQQVQQFNASPTGEYLSNLGIQANEQWGSAFNSQPSLSAQTLFKQIYDMSGLGDLKGQIDMQTKEIQKLDDEMFDKIQEVNDNPWLVEGVRVQRIQKLQDKYENKKANLVSALRLSQGMYDSGREDARWAVSQTISQFNADRNFAQGQLEFAIQRAESAAEAERRAIQQEFENELKVARLELDTYKATSGGSGSGSSGGSRTQQVLDGFITLDQLTPTEAQKVRDDLYARGFGSDTPPQWFVDFLQNQRRQSLLPSVVQEEWIRYRDSILKEEGTTSSTLSDEEFLKAIGE